MRAALVCEESLAEVAEQLQLRSFVRTGKTVGEIGDSMLADCVEAIVGAVYLDADFQVTAKLVRELFANKVENGFSHLLMLDHKTVLQEWVQEQKKLTPSYELIGREGPPHQPSFEVGVLIGGEMVAKAKGRSKKRAAQRAARIAWEQLMVGEHG